MRKLAYGTADVERGYEREWKWVRLRKSGQIYQTRMTVDANRRGYRLLKKYWTERGELSQRKKRLSTSTTRQQEAARRRLRNRQWRRKKQGVRESDTETKILSS